MLTRHHALSGAVVWLALAPAATALSGHPATLAQLGLGAVCCAGAGSLPDLDEPNSNPSRALGPASQIVSAGVGAVSGGHRRATHSVLAVALAAVGSWVAVRQGVLGEAVLVGVLALLCVHLLGPKAVRAHSLAGAAVGAGLGFLVAGHPVLAGGWLIWATAGGVAAHIAGDGLTHGGVPLAWPGKWRPGLHLFRVGGSIESAVGLVLLAALLALGWLRFAGLIPAGWL